MTLVADMRGGICHEGLLLLSTTFLEYSLQRVEQQASNNTVHSMRRGNLLEIATTRDALVVLVLLLGSVRVGSFRQSYPRR